MSFVFVRCVRQVETINGRSAASAPSPSVAAPAREVVEWLLLEGRHAPGFEQMMDRFCRRLMAS
ncbi:hypothetical protein GAY28_33675, partial [Azospirillum brasilense]|nr:hypothetical protein [Azospirillum brasilense]